VLVTTAGVGVAVMNGADVGVAVAIGVGVAVTNGTVGVAAGVGEDAPS